VRGVELSVSRVVRVQVETVQPVPVPLHDRQLAEDAALAGIAVEIEIDRKLLRVLVEDVERSVEVADEHALRAANLFSQGIHPGEQQLVRRLAVDQAGHRHDEEVPELQRRLRHGGRRAQHYGRQREVRALNSAAHGLLLQ
jgi:hypothetical protein